METVDQIRDIVASMTPIIDIDSVVDNGDGTQTLFSCNTYWVRKYLTVTIDGNDYEVLSFVQNESITISSSPLVTVNSFVLQAPYYYHGTPRQANEEWIIKGNENDKYPLIYLVESMNEFFYDEEQAEEKDSPLLIFFLDSFANNNDEVDGHYTNVVKPLISMTNYFVDLLKSNPMTAVFSYNKNNRVKVGVETTNQGSTSHVLSDPLNAVEFVSTVTWFKGTDECLC